ncbi:SRPBCC domain-containing protein [Flavobacterium sp. D11R37]|uniref:SRPBCC domain-containing protein n=1 Tax=Flavobacterium coralii TaxID=2838017 RepID=UPI001CA669C1|nr:SRPBCC domain-containing protein [Flavobacterium coralii]MBY8961655.1 SRPBCC domain-containing protein [Flavobacterium coralii]
MEQPTGKTKNSGYQAGVRKTFAISLQDAWQLVFSGKAMAIWLGDETDLRTVKGSPYKTGNGITGTVRVVKEFSHVRLTYKKENWHSESLVQIRFIPAKTGTTISYHQEKLADAAQREEMKQHWEAALTKFTELL